MRKPHPTLLGSLLCLSLLGAAPVTHVDHPGLVKLHWQQAGDANTFREMTTFDMIELLHEMDVHHIALAPGQSLSPEHKDWKTGDEMPGEAADALLAKLKSVKMDIVCYGPVDFGKTESEARLVFEFGKKLKLKTLISDAPAEQLEMLDKLATEYQINVAITTGSTSGRKAPNDLALAIKGRSARIGVCADLPAWQLAGRNAIEVTTLDEHVLIVVLSDVDSQPNLKPILTMLHNASFRGICCIEDRTEDPEARLENFAKSINAFNVIVTELAKNQHGNNP